MIMRGKSRLAVAAAAICGASVVSRAAVVTYVGEQTNTGGTWRTSNLGTNAYSVNPDGYYGNDGYILYNTTPTGTVTGSNGPSAHGTDISLKPSYVSAITKTQDSGAQGYGYPTIQNPTTTPGATPTTLESGTLGSSGGTLFTVTLTGTVPASFRVGVITGAPGTTYDSSSVTLSDTGTGGSASAPESSANGRLDMYFFNVTGAAAGDVLNFGGTVGGTGTAGFNEITGASFDSVPEPATIGILGMSALGLLVRRRDRFGSK